MSIFIGENKTMLFIGDSITDCGRRNDHRPLGNGYVKLFHDLLAIREPEKRRVIVNKGIGGNRVVDLRDRWVDDVLGHKPDFLSVKIGINDLHAYLRETPTSVPPELFRKTYEEILEMSRKQSPKLDLLLIDPFYISRDHNPHSCRCQVLKALPEYIDIVHQMAKRYDARLVKTQEIFEKLLAWHDPDLFCPEPVHPYLIGHMVIAEAVYDALRA